MRRRNFFGTALAVLVPAAWVGEEVEGKQSSSTTCTSDVPLAGGFVFPEKYEHIIDAPVLVGGSYNIYRSVPVKPSPKKEECELKPLVSKKVVCQLFCTDSNVEVNIDKQEAVGYDFTLVGTIKIQNDGRKSWEEIEKQFPIMAGESFILSKTRTGEWLCQKQ